MPERALSLPHQAAPGAPRRERLVFFLLALSLIANTAHAQALFSDDFASSSNWQAELENGGTVDAHGGKLTIDVPAGCTVWFKPQLAGPVLIEYEATRSATLQGGYFIVAARALDLDCGPMGGFDHAKLDAEFFPGGKVKSIFLCNLGYGDRSTLRPRAPRLAFDDACQIV